MTLLLHSTCRIRLHGASGPQLRFHSSFRFTSQDSLPLSILPLSQFFTSQFPSRLSLLHFSVFNPSQYSTPWTLGPPALTFTSVAHFPCPFPLTSLPHLARKHPPHHTPTPPSPLSERSTPPASRGCGPPALRRSTRRGVIISNISTLSERSTLPINGWGCGPLALRLLTERGSSGATSACMGGGNSNAESGRGLLAEDLCPSGPSNNFCTQTTEHAQILPFFHCEVQLVWACEEEIMSTALVHHATTPP